MRPPAMNPRFGAQGQDRSNSPHQNMTRPQFPRGPPPFHKGPRHSRGNGNMNRPRRPQGPQGLMEGPGGQMMRPNAPMMGPNGPMLPMMMPCGPMMGPNGPMAPPGFMDPASFNMMMRCMIPGAPMPKFENGDFSKPTYQSSGTEKEGVQESDDKKPGMKKSTGQNNFSANGESSNYNYSQFSNFQNPNCGWQGNAFPGPWNFNMNQFYSPNSGQNYDQQFGNNQNFYQNSDQNLNGNYNQYQNQPYVQGDFYNDNQNHSQFKPNPNNRQNGAHNSGPKTPTKNNSKKKEMCQKMRTHYCDTCDKSFPTEEALATHLAEHKVCGLDGCKFTAHPKVVDKHQQMQHFTGLYRRIGSLYTPEDIDKWRKDRKKNYPTPQNVEERRAKQEEMYARGERMGERNNRFPRQNQQRNARQFQPRPNPRPDGQQRGDSLDRRPPPPSGPPSGPPTGPAEPPKKWKPIYPPITFEIEESEVRSGVVAFPGTAALLPKMTPMETGESAQTKNSSLSFLSMYGDSASEGDSDTEKSPDDPASCPVDENIRPGSETLTSEARGSTKPDSKDLQAGPTSLVEHSKDVEIGEVSPQEVEANSSGCSGGLQNGIAKEESVIVDASEPADVPSVPSEELEHPVSNSTGKPQHPSDPTGTEEEKDPGDPTGTKEKDPSDPTGTKEKDPSDPSGTKEKDPSDPTGTEEEKDPGDPTGTKEKDPSDPTGTKEKDPSDPTGTKEKDPSDPTGTKEKDPSDPSGTKEGKDPLSEGETNAMDDSDDSGPEEVPISKSAVGDSIGDKENSQDEEIDEVVKSGEGGRKRKRQSRQPAKKLKTEDEKPTGSQPQQQNKRHDNSSRPQRPPHRPPIRRAPTLLEKLLGKEICHERNVILQCVRYVVENNYFRGDRPQLPEASTL